MHSKIEITLLFSVLRSLTCSDILVYSEFGKTNCKLAVKFPLGTLGRNMWHSFNEVVINNLMVLFFAHNRMRSGCGANEAIAFDIFMPLLIFFFVQMES